jgi:hypothetical protein
MVQHSSGNSAAIDLVQDLARSADCQVISQHACRSCQKRIGSEPVRTGAFTVAGGAHQRGAMRRLGGLDSEGPAMREGLVDRGPEQGRG